MLLHIPLISPSSLSIRLEFNIAILESAQRITTDSFGHHSLKQHSEIKQAVLKVSYSNIGELTMFLLFSGHGFEKLRERICLSPCLVERQ